MNNAIIDEAANRIKNSRSMVATWSFLLVVWIIVAVISYADWRASVHGFDQLPINTLDWWWLGEFIGALPQVTQGVAFIFFTSALTVGSKWWFPYAGLWAVAFSFDAYTDYVFFLTDQPGSEVVSFTLAVFIFTLFSEWIIAVITPVLITTLPIVMPEFGKFWASIMDGGTKFLTSFADNNNNTSKNVPGNRNIPLNAPKREEPTVIDPRFPQRPPKRR